MTSTSSAGVYGIAFSPYVGPCDAAGPVLYNTYTLDQVTALLTPVAARFSRIATYGQGTFVWQNVPQIQDANRCNIQAAKAVGLNVCAGCYQQGADPGADVINVEWTKAEINYAIDQATTYGNVVELVIGNECLWGPNSTQAIIELINYAKSKRAPHFTQETLPITTRQRWDVLGGVNNMTPGYAAMRQALLALLSACEGFVYANMYAYFDPNIAGQIARNPTQASFTQAVTNSMTGSLAALRNAFAGQNVSTEVRIGETGWPTRGAQPAQPNAFLASVQQAQWYAQAMQNWSASNGVRTILFEAYDEPWKGSPDNSNSEGCFGIWQAEGTSSAQNQYTLTGETLKYPLSAAQVAW
jgi:exo-beta-1,3-glucanase (GH17 family)